MAVISSIAFGGGPVVGRAQAHGQLGGCPNRLLRARAQAQDSSEADLEPGADQLGGWLAGRREPLGGGKDLFPRRVMLGLAV